MLCHEAFLASLLRLPPLQDWAKHILQSCDWAINPSHATDYSLANPSDLRDLVTVSLHSINLSIFPSRGLDEKVSDLNVHGFLYLPEAARFCRISLIHQINITCNIRLTKAH